MFDILGFTLSSGELFVRIRYVDRISDGDFEARGFEESYLQHAHLQGSCSP